MKRRNFIKVGAAGLASPILLAGNKNMKVNKNNPIVISTWSHGIPANEASIKTSNFIEDNHIEIDKKINTKPYLIKSHLDNSIEIKKLN